MISNQNKQMNVTDRELGGIEKTLEILVKSHDELRREVKNIYENLLSDQKDQEKRLDRIEKRVQWIYAWAAGAFFMIGTVAYLLFNIWRQVG